jgi:methanogenic corrinoid protein MtbC1
VGPDSATAAPASGDSLATLIHTIQAEIIPRMLVAHRAGAPAAVAEAREPPEPWEQSIDRLIDLVLEDDPDAAPAYVRGLRERGRGTAAILLQLLTPTARRLGELWTADELSFTGVSIALGRLQAMLWDLSLTARDQDFAGIGPARGRVLISALPGEQHTFGAAIVAEFFRWWGWDVVAGPFASPRALRDAVGQGNFTLVGLSLGAERHLDGLALEIERIRTESANGVVGVVVGGRVFIDCPTLFREVGADASAETADGAADVAAALVARQQHFAD